ncbi:MAG: hypothetical protein WBP72_07315 [Rhodocyclaceae bacterium]
MGIPGAMGAVLGAVAVAFLLSAVMPAERELAQTRLAVRQATERKAKPQEPGAAEVKSPQDQLKAFYEAFPKESAASDSLQQIYDAAKQHSISLPHGEYTLVMDDKAGLARYRITLPVTGSYQNIRGFINAALSASPTLALEHVDFQRQKVGDPELEAKIRFSLLLLKQ